MTQGPSHAKLLGLLVSSLKSVPQAQRELQWIKNELPPAKWLQACKDRSNHYPLQYILGSQPFGELDIKCKPNVLIPRNDTEEWCSSLRDNLSKDPTVSNMRILDMCTGSGCIALSLSCLPNVSRVVGMDLSDDAISLSLENLDINKSLVSPHCDVSFTKRDVMDPTATKLDNTDETFDLIVSNPPYIPLDHFNEANGVEESVQLYEPRLALVGDLEFYKALVANIVVPYRSRGFVFELGYRSQAIATLVELQRFKKPYSWECGIKYDSSDNIRNVIGWDKESEFDFSDLCDEIISIDT